jgi:FkbM family methyltransferase
LKDRLKHSRVLRGPRLRSCVRAARRARRRFYEWIGSDRYSHPAAHDLDRKLAEYLPHHDGVFIEAGAYDGYYESNTYWFERRRGWTGLLVEPIPELASEARRQRPRTRVVECALIPFDSNLETVTMRYGGPMSLVPGAQVNDAADREHARTGAEGMRREVYEVTVPARTLTSVLDECGIHEVDLLSLDVEGYEASVLRGLDLTRHAPRFIVVEALDEDHQRPDIEAVLGGYYAHEARLSVRDHLYRRLF